VSLIFAVLHFGYRSLLDVVFVLVVALFFSVVVSTTRSLIGVTVAHGLTNVALFLIFPFVLNPLPSDVSEIPSISKTMTLVVSVPMVSPSISQDSTAISTLILNLPTTPFGEPTFQASIDSTNTVVSLTPSATYTPSIAAVIVDDGDAGYFRTGGWWWASDLGYAGDLLFANAQNGPPDCVIEWHPDIFTCGKYNLEVYIPVGFGTTQSAHYQISSRQGIIEKTINQASFQGEWANLGEYEFEQGTVTFLRATNMTNEDMSLGRYIVFDAARWIYVSPCPVVSPGTP
jgi:hypothetical protein